LFPLFLGISDLLYKQNYGRRGSMFLEKDNQNQRAELLGARPHVFMPQDGSPAVAGRHPETLTLLCIAM
jgi:hypothetical protein